MVTGIDRFRAHFEGYDSQYVLIGGAACELLMDSVGLDFRATKDLKPKKVAMRPDQKRLPTAGR